MAAAASLLSRSPFPLLTPPRSEFTRSAIPSHLGPLPSSSSSPRPSPLDFPLRSKTPKPPTRVPPPPPCSSGDLQEEASKPPQDLALLLEVEGVLADVYRLGIREAFNKAFRELGLDCANWTEPIYADLLRKAAGDEERMLMLFFNRIGWPTSLPTNEKETFMKSILREKQKALEVFAASNSLPLRPGVENFIDDALKEGVTVVMLTAYSKFGEKLSRSIIEKLGHDRMPKIEVIGKKEVEGSFYAQLVLGKGVSSSLDEQIVKEARKAVSVEKQKVAKEVASILKLSVDIDTSPSESLENVVATLRAGSEYAGLPVHNCVLIAGSQSGVLAAERVGMPSVVLRNSLTARAEFRKAKAVMDGFGGADLTLHKLRDKRWS